MSEASSLPPWEVTPPWEKRAPAAPVVQKARFAHLENTFIPPLPPPKPVSTPPPQPSSNAHRRAISLPRNPRPVRPKVPNSARPVEPAPQSTTNSPPISAADSIPPPVLESIQSTRTRSRSSTLPGTDATSPASVSSNSSRPPLPVKNSYPFPPSSNKSPISPQIRPANIREDNTDPTNKSLPPPPPQPDTLPTDIVPVTLRTSRFNALKRSLSLKILPQDSNARGSPSAEGALPATPQPPTPPTPELLANRANIIGPSRSLTSRKKHSKRLASPSYNEEIFARIETEGSRVVAVGINDKDVSEYIARSPRTLKASTLPSPRAAIKSSKSVHVRQRSRRLASPGYVQEKYSLMEKWGNRDMDIMGDAIVSGGRSPGIQDEETETNTKSVADGSKSQTIPGRPDSSKFDILDMHDEKMAPSSPKPEPLKESSAGPRLIPLKYSSVTSSKEAAPSGPALPKLIPLKFLSPPSPEESEDEFFVYSHEPIDDPVAKPEPSLEIAPLRIKSTESAPIQASRPNSAATTQALSPLTARLISRATPKKLYNATHSTFLRSCSNGKITVPLLSRYLTQERIFMHSYLRFLALLLANISVPPKPAQLKAPKSTSEKKEKDLNARLTFHLINQLSHTQSKLSLFSNLPLDLKSWDENGNGDGMTDATRMLVRLFDVIGSAIERGEKSVLVGVVVCWIREKVCSHSSPFLFQRFPSDCVVIFFMLTGRRRQCLRLGKKSTPLCLLQTPLNHQPQHQHRR